MHYFENYPPPYHDVTTASLSPASRKKLRLLPTADIKASDVVKSCYSFLRVSSEYFRRQWNWSDFFDYVEHEDKFVCW